MYRGENGIVAPIENRMISIIVLSLSTCNRGDNDEQQPLTDEPADAVPAVRNAVDRYRRVKKQLSQYSAAQKVLEERTTDAAKLAAVHNAGAHCGCY